MKKVIIIEDEAVALRKMKKLIAEIRPEVQILAALESVQEAQDWFSEQESTDDIDLIFSDIQLSDGLSFEIFEQQNAHLPIVFTTAYDEYALRAFKVNGVGYLLKPIQKEELEAVIVHFEQTKKRYSKTQITDIQELITQFQQPKKNNPNFIAVQKDKLIPISADSIAYFYTSNQIVYAVVENAKYALDETLEDIEVRLPDAYFFRANRQFIVQKRFINDAEIYFNNRLSLHLKVNIPEPIIISREKASAFKNWLMGK